MGRYTDPHFAEAMHERHTLYRREQAAEWNYRPSNTYALPLGPVVAESNPSPSDHAATDAEQMNAQQKAYAEALLDKIAPSISESKSCKSRIPRFRASVKKSSG